MLLLKYLSNFLRTCEMLLINCGIKIMLTWFENCFIWSNAPADKKKTTFVITDTKLYVPVETLSTSDNTKLLQ